MHECGGEGGGWRGRRGGGGTAKDSKSDWAMRSLLSFVSKRCAVVMTWHALGRWRGGDGLSQGGGGERRGTAAMGVRGSLGGVDGVAHLGVDAESVGEGVVPVHLHRLPVLNHASLERHGTIRLLQPRRRHDCTRRLLAAEANLDAAAAAVEGDCRPLGLCKQVRPRHALRRDTLPPPSRTLIASVVHSLVIEKKIRRPCY